MVSGSFRCGLEANRKPASNIEYRDVIATAITNNGSIIPKNTDFFDSLDVHDVKIERVWVNIDDDCFSPKSNNTNLYVNTMYCNGMKIVLLY